MSSFAATTYTLATYQDQSTPEARARALLFSHLTPAQRWQFATTGWFEVKGGYTHRTYRIHRRYLNDNLGRNVTWMRRGKRMRSYDTHTRVYLPESDGLLAQKLALEDRRVERRFLRMACTTSHHRGLLWAWPHGWFAWVINAVLALQIINIGWMLYRLAH